MRLIDDDVAPVKLLEVSLLLNHHLVAGHHHIKLARHAHVVTLVGLRKWMKDASRHLCRFLSVLAAIDAYA